jgi:predicted GNAT family acetyltransferase
MTEQPNRTIEIRQEEANGHGAFYVERNGERLGEMTYARESERLITIEHTNVHEQLHGLGIGRKLLESAVAWARSTHTRVIAACPYASAQFAKDPSIRDVLER